MTTSADVVIRAINLRKESRIGAAGGLYRTLRESPVSMAQDGSFGTPSVAMELRAHLGPEELEPRGRPGRNGRNYQPERGQKDHVTEGDLKDHRADHRSPRFCREGRVPA